MTNKTNPVQTNVQTNYLTLCEGRESRLDAKSIESTCYDCCYVYRRSRTEWSNFLNRSPERFNIRIPELPTDKDQRFVGYAVRYLRPEVTRSWRVSAVKCHRDRKHWHSQ